MGDLIEAAKSNRSSCRACWKRIERGELRYGASEESFYGDGAESYAWFHPKCAAQRMPERALDVFKAVGPVTLPDFDALIAAAEKALATTASKFPYGERAPSSRSKCMRCREAIEKGQLRVAIEREIDTGGFATTGAGYLHPKCAVEHLQEPQLAALLAQNSDLLSAAEKSELVAIVGSVPAPDAPKRAARVTQKVAKPKESADEELVFADALIEKGDPRGELIVVATELDVLGLDDAKGPALAARALELAPTAQKLWASELGLSPADFYLERGLPSGLRVELGPKSELPSHPWITGYAIEGAGGPELARLLASEPFTRIRHLVLEDTKVSWDGFRELITSPGVKHLRSLDIFVNVGARGVHMLFTSRQLESLEHVTVSVNPQATPDLRGFDSVAGLPSLRTLHVTTGASSALVGALLRSPLAKRVEELGINGWALPDDVPPLPNLKRLFVLAGALLPLTAMNLAKNVDRFPNLRRFDITATKTDEKSVKLLRKTFGDRLIARTPEPTPAKKKASAKRKTAAKKTSRKP